MAQADFTNVIKTILIILFIYYFIRFSMRLLAPYLMKKAFEKVQQNFQRQTEEFFNQAQGNNHQSTRDRQSESNQSGATKLKEKKKVGEYIDYEEID